MKKLRNVTENTCWIENRALIRRPTFRKQVRV